MGDFCTDAYLTPMINQVYEDQTTELMADTDSSFDEWVFDVPGVPPGTTSLQIYQAAEMPTPAGGVTNGPLYGLVNPIVLEWKQGGQPVGYYREVNRKAKLGNHSPAAPYPSICSEWEWRGYTIFLTPVMYTIDLRLRGEFSPPSLVKDTDCLIVHPRMATATAYGAAALIGVERNNQNFVDKYSAAAESVMDNISNLLTKGEQGTVSRIGRLSGCAGGRNWGWGGQG